MATYWLEKRYPTATMTLALFSALGGTTLERIGERMARALEARDIDQARELVPWLCSRDPQYLDEQGIIRATVESLAENTSDAATAPILWATCGASGVALHRLVNTLDAMVGYRSRGTRISGGRQPPLMTCWPTCRPASPPGCMWSTLRPVGDCRGRGGRW